MNVWVYTGYSVTIKDCISIYADDKIRMKDDHISNRYEVGTITF